LKKPLLFHPAAQQEILAAHGWYAEQSQQAADGFYEELLPAFDRIQQWPELYPAGPHGTQRLVLARYPFSIFYRELLEQIQVIAIAHAKRRPGYWAGRV
jgi:plasmid stabilization system protein ParE